MKTKILIMLLIICSGCLISCNNDDDNTTQEETLAGVWNLKNVHGGLIVVNIDYNLGEVKWNFNFSNNTLIVENNIMTAGPEDIYAGLDSGTYNFEVEQNEEMQILYINNSERGVIILSENTLEIDNGLASDGFITKFKR